MNCDSMGKFELFIGLEGFSAGASGSLYRAVLTALRHNGSLK